MSAKSNIEWTDATWPIVQGCDPVSPGCVHCYAVFTLWRLMHNSNPTISALLAGLVEKHRNASGKDILRFTGKVALRHDRLDWPLTWREPKMIFVPSHGDLFHKDVPRAFIAKVFARMRQAHWHTFQVLTKRVDRAHELLDDPDFVVEVLAELPAEHRGGLGVQWPLPNVWLGVSAERQQEADERIPLLLQTPAAVRFVSCEPLLGPIDLERVWARMPGGGRTCWNALRRCAYDGDDGRAGRYLGADVSTGDFHHLDWVIIGGESGKDARPMHPDWARGIRDQCATAGVPFFFKQWGEFLPSDHDGPWVEPPNDGQCYRVGKKAAGRLLDGREWNEFPQPTTEAEAAA